MSDKNYISIAGNPSGELFIFDPRRPEGEQNTLLRRAGDLTHVSVNFLVGIQPPAGYSDVLKISGAVNLTVNATEVYGGSEDVVDINHSTDVVVNIKVAYPRGRYVSTIKGGSQRITLNIASQVGHGTQADHDIGNWSDQSKEKTGLVKIHAVTADSSAVKVRVLHARWKPDVSPISQRFDIYMPWWRNLFYPVMRILKLFRLA